MGLLGNGEVEVKAVLAFNSFPARNLCRWRISVEVEMETPGPGKSWQARPGLVGCAIREGDDLWGLAKRYHATVEGIRQAERPGRQRAPVKPGEKLLIFKENMSIL